MSEQDESNELVLNIGGEIEQSAAARVFHQGVQFDIAKFEERQPEVDELVAKYPNNLERRVRELNRKIRNWDDDYGISYLDIAGGELPGLEIHGVAEKFSFSGNSAPGANFEGARMNASLFTASDLSGLNARRASLDSAIFLMTALERANLEDVSAIDANFNLADLTDANVRGANLSSAYLLGTRGLSEELLKEMADVTAARALIPVEEAEKRVSEILREGLAGRFIDVQDQDIRNRLDQVLVINGLNLSKALLDQKRMEGMILDNVILNKTRLVDRDFTANIWHRLHAAEIVLRAARAAGLLVLNSDLHDADLTKIWTPGSLFVRSSLRGASMPGPGTNVAGAVFLDTDLEKMDTTNANFDGALVVGGTVSEFPENSRVKTARLSELPRSVGARLAEFGRLAIAVQKERPALPG